MTLPTLRTQECPVVPSSCSEGRGPSGPFPYRTDGWYRGRTPSEHRVLWIVSFTTVLLSITSPEEVLGPRLVHSLSREREYGYVVISVLRGFTFSRYPILR